MIAPDEDDVTITDIVQSKRSLVNFRIKLICPVAKYLSKLRRNQWGKRNEAKNLC